MTDSTSTPETASDGVPAAVAGTRKSSAKPARSRSREFALQALYQHLVGRNDASDIDVFTRDLSGFHKACQENAQRLVTLLSCALMSDVKFPADRCNRKMQPKGSLECGFFVCHWLEQSIREELGEGPFAIGLPNITRVYERLHNCSSSIVRHKGWAALHE